MKNPRSETTTLESSLQSLDLEALAKESGWSAKSRKVTALNWCVALCMACTHKTPSLRVAAHVMGLVNALSISKQALHGRLLKGGAKLIEKALGSAVATKARGGVSLAGFNRVLVQDSTRVGLPKSMRKHYPGSRNQCASSSAMRIQAIYDMVSNRFVEFALGAFTRNDHAASCDILELVEPGDLVLRDLGYLSLGALQGLDELGAFYLSRHMDSFKLFDPESGERIDLERFLDPDRARDVQVLVGVEAKAPARLIAIPLAEEVANRRRQKAKCNRDRRRVPGKRALYLLGWQLMLTNCPETRLPVSHAFELYSMRWRIETLFKSWKSGLCIDSVVTHTSKKMVEAMVYASLLRVTLVHAVIVPWLEARDPQRKVSMVKLMDLIAMSASLVAEDQASIENLLENLSRHSRYDKRKRMNTLEKWDSLVSEMENLS